MFVLHGVVGDNLADLDRNVLLFAGGEFAKKAEGCRYTVDTYCLEHKAGDEMRFLKFAPVSCLTKMIEGETTVADSEEETDASAMDE